MGKTLKELILQMKVFAEHGDNVSDQLFDIIQQQAADNKALREALEAIFDTTAAIKAEYIVDVIRGRVRHALAATDPNRVIGE